MDSGSTAPTCSAILDPLDAESMIPSKGIWGVVKKDIGVNGVILGCIGFKVPKISCTFLGVPIRRIIVYLGLCGYHMQITAHSAKASHSDCMLFRQLVQL